VPVLLFAAAAMGLIAPGGWVTGALAAAAIPLVAALALVLALGMAVRPRAGAGAASEAVSRLELVSPSQFFGLLAGVCASALGGLDWGVWKVLSGAQAVLLLGGIVAVSCWTALRGLGPEVDGRDRRAYILTLLGQALTLGWLGALLFGWVEAGGCPAPGAGGPPLLVCVPWPLADADVAYYPLLALSYAVGALVVETFVKMVLSKNG